MKVCRREITKRLRALASPWHRGKLPIYLYLEVMELLDYHSTGNDEDIVDIDRESRLVNDCRAILLKTNFQQQIKKCRYDNCFDIACRDGYCEHHHAYENYTSK